LPHACSKALINSRTLYPRPVPRLKDNSGDKWQQVIGNALRVFPN
jgi:hypothetical protein